MKNLLKLTEKKAGAWVNNLINEMVLLVIDGKLENDYNKLKEFVETNYERF